MPEKAILRFWTEIFAESGRKWEDTFRVLFQSAPCSKSEVRNKFRNHLRAFWCKSARVPLMLLRLNPIWNPAKEKNGELRCIYDTWLLSENQRGFSVWVQNCERSRPLVNGEFPRRRVREGLRKARKGVLHGESARATSFAQPSEWTRYSEK